MFLWKTLEDVCKNLMFLWKTLGRRSEDVVFSWKMLIWIQKEKYLCFLSKVYIFHKNTTSSERLPNVFHENTRLLHTSSKVFHKNIMVFVSFHNIVCLVALVVPRSKLLIFTTCCLIFLGSKLGANAPRQLCWWGGIQVCRNAVVGIVRRLAKWIESFCLKVCEGTVDRNN